VKRFRRYSRGLVLDFDRCEARNLQTLVFVFDGNGFGAANPSNLTANAAEVLRAHGDQAIQLSNPAVTTPDVFFGLEREIKSLSRGQPIGIVGFSAGGALAFRLAADDALHVKDVLDYYGPPDLRDFITSHHGDGYDSYVLRQINSNPAVINLLSGPENTQAHVVAAFGSTDPVVLAGPSVASLRKDDPQADIYGYHGHHGVSIFASPAALQDFLTHL
jgi:dienelactone hydrolase